MCAHEEHFLEYREIVKEQIETQLAEYLAQKSQLDTKFSLSKS